MLHISCAPCFCFPCVQDTRANGEQQIYMSVDCDLYDSFTVTTANTVNGLSIDGCYVDTSDSITDPFYALNGVLEEDQFIVYGRTTTTWGVDHEIWAFGFLAETLDDVDSHFCRDDSLQDASTLHPTEVTNWMCWSSADDDYTVPMSVDSTCNCFTPAPTLSPFSTSSPIPPTSSPVGTLLPTTSPLATLAPTGITAVPATVSTFPPTTPPLATVAPAGITAVPATVSTFPPTTPPRATVAPAEITAVPATVSTFPPTTPPRATAAPIGTAVTSPASSDGVGGIVGGTAAALAATAALMWVFLRRRRQRAAKKKGANPRDPRLDDDGEDHEQQQRGVSSPTPIVVAGGGSGVSGLPSQRDTSPAPPHAQTHQRNAPPPPYGGSRQQPAAVTITTGTKDNERAQQSLRSTAAPLVGAVRLGEEQSVHADEDGGGFIAPAAGGGAAGDNGSARQLSLTATISTANMSKEERSELASGIGFLAGEDDDAVPLADGQLTGEGEAPSTAGGRRGSGVEFGQGVLAAALELVHHCQIPGVSEAATAVSILIRLVSDSRDLRRGDTRVKQCRSIVVMLERAAKVLGKGGDTNGEVERVLMEDVHDAVSDLVELITTYQSKNKLSKVMVSSLFKRRQDELDAVVDRAILRLHLGLQMQMGHDVKEGLHLQKGSVAEARAESLAEARSARRQRKLDQIEITEDHVAITDELLGKGGFGEVYLADYNGHNAAAKVQHITHGFGRPSEDDVLNGPRTDQSPDAQREKSQRKAFLRELDTMIRLRSPHTVNVYGAITSVPERLVLVMELLAGGDLRNMLKNSEQPLSEERVRQTIRDICAGMAFLHSKGTVHGDLKSANILLDGRGRAKIGDFGTSRWAQTSERSTGLATYTTAAGPITHISFAWTAPEVLETKAISNASDVYSYGIVVWEVLSRKIPWADQALPRDIYLRVVIRGDRPAMPADTPADIAEMITGCWAQAHEDRPTFHELMDGGTTDRR
ncbi:unnamed protein product [Scytosiphon promiscuus]